MECPICEVLGNNNLNVQRFVAEILLPFLEKSCRYLRSNIEDPSSTSAQGAPPDVAFDDLEMLGTASHHEEKYSGESRRATSREPEDFRRGELTPNKDIVHRDIRPRKLTWGTRSIEMGSGDLRASGDRYGTQENLNSKEDTSGKIKREMNLIRGERVNTETNYPRKRLLPEKMRQRDGLSSNRAGAEAGKFSKQVKTPKRACYGVNKKNRRDLITVECDMCKGWQEGLHLIDIDGENHCRHRFEGVPTSTPKGYWDVAFPPTQQENGVLRLD